VSALQEIKLIGEELENVDTSSQEGMSSAEWRRYKELISNERDVAQFLDMDMPTDPYLHNRLHEVASRLRELIRIIDANAAELDKAIRRAG
jgi:hypothetical protein